MWLRQGKDQGNLLYQYTFPKVPCILAGDKKQNKTLICMIWIYTDTSCCVIFPVVTQEPQSQLFTFIFLSFLFFFFNKTKKIKKGLKKRKRKKV